MRSSGIYIFLYGSEMRGLPGERILGSLEHSRQPASADGTLYAPSASFPVAVFGDGSGNVVKGELVQVQESRMAAALTALSQANGYLGKGNTGNTVELVEIDAHPFGGEEVIGHVWAFAAPKHFTPDAADAIEGGDWRAYRESLSGQQGITPAASSLAQASAG